MKIFADKEGRRVVASHVDMEFQMHYHPEGGGPACIMEAAAFYKQYKPAPAVAYRLSEVRGDWAEVEDDEFPCYLSDQRWNGWAVPYFTKEQAQAVVADHPTIWSGGLVWQDDVILYTFPVDGEITETEIIKPTTITVDGQDLQVYQLCDGWCWVEVP